MMIASGAPRMSVIQQRRLSAQGIELCVLRRVHMHQRKLSAQGIELCVFRSSYPVWHRSYMFASVLHLESKCLRIDIIALILLSQLLAQQMLKVFDR